MPHLLALSRPYKTPLISQYPENESNNASSPKSPGEEFFAAKATIQAAPKQAEAIRILRDMYRRNVMAILQEVADDVLKSYAKRGIRKKLFIGESTCYKEISRRQKVEYSQTCYSIRENGLLFERHRLSIIPCRDLEAEAQIINGKVLDHNNNNVLGSISLSSETSIREATKRDIARALAACGF